MVKGAWLCMLGHGSSRKSKGHFCCLIESLAVWKDTAIFYSFLAGSLSASVCSSLLFHYTRDGFSPPEGRSSVV